MVKKNNSSMPTQENRKQVVLHFILDVGRCSQTVTTFFPLFSPAFLAKRLN